MRKFSIKTILISIILIIISVFFVMYSKIINNPISVDKDITIGVQEGDTFYGIIDSLNKENIIKGVPFIKLYIMMTGIDVDVKPGNHNIEKDITLRELIENLNEEDMNYTSFTVPEGYTVEDIAKKLNDENIVTEEEFIKEVKNYDLPIYVTKDSNKRYNLEGYLFPDTYILREEYTAKDIIKIMIERFELAISTAISDTGIDINSEDIEEVITIASIIEREAVLNEERKTISSVIQNRIAINMKLQIDATVIYSLGKHVEIVSYDNLEFDSPYNTYKYYGLPVGPISNPGLESIIAAMKPEETDYLFYVLKDDSSHYFTDNYDDFINKQYELGY